MRPTDWRARWALRRRAELRSGEDRPDRGRAGPDGQDFEDAEDCRARQQQGSVAPETGSSSSHTRVHERASPRERGAKETPGLLGARWRWRSDASADGEWAQRDAAKNATTKAGVDYCLVSFSYGVIILYFCKICSSMPIVRSSKFFCFLSLPKLAFCNFEVPAPSFGDDKVPTIKAIAAIAIPHRQPIAPVAWQYTVRRMRGGSPKAYLQHTPAACTCQQRGGPAAAAPREEEAQLHGACC